MGGSNTGYQLSPEAQAQIMQNMGMSSPTAASPKPKMGDLVEANGGYTAVEAGKNRIGMERPDFLTRRTTDGGLDDRFKSTLGDSYSALKDKAMAQGDSTWAQLQRQQLQDQYSAGANQLAAQGAGQQAQARQNLAMRGGVSTGARERLAGMGMRNQMAGMQGLGRNLNQANLQVSMADEANKNQLLQGLGRTEQMIQDNNIGRLSSDIDNQNKFMATNYGEDVRAYAAEKSAKASRPSSCFLGMTEVAMADHSFKMIKDIKLGDEMLEGGRVTFLSQALSTDIYNYKGIHVTGSHAVLEDGEWMRVKDSKHSTKMDNPEMVVYCVGNAGHRILTKAARFADFWEVDNGDNLTDEQAIEALNEGMD